MFENYRGCKLPDLVLKVDESNYGFLNFEFRIMIK
jgi:hypothetical protein